MNVKCQSLALLDYELGTLQASNTERVLFRHYLKLVKKSDVEKFWNIFQTK